MTQQYEESHPDAAPAADCDHTQPDGRAGSVAYSSLTVLGSTAYGRLWWYDLSSRWRGADYRRAAAVLSHWSRSAWPRLGLAVDVHGQPRTAPCVYVANHRSYLDIAVLSGALSATFLSRADVAAWPLVGAVAQRIGTVFVDRDDPQARMRAARALMRRVRTMGVIVFPEGTTHGDPLPRAFPLGLFRLVHRLGVPIVPVTVRYDARRAYWSEDLTIWEHWRDRVHRGGPLRCTIDIGDDLRAAAFADGASLAEATHAAVCRPIVEHGELA